MKIFGRILSIAFVIMLVTSMGSGALLANNHGDTAYTFVFPNNYDYQYTSGRYKMDESAYSGLIWTPVPVNSGQ